MFAFTDVEYFSRQDFFDKASAGITNMDYMFKYSSFNQPISWDVSNVESMKGMFYDSHF